MTELSDAINPDDLNPMLCIIFKKECQLVESITL